MERFDVVVVGAGPGGSTAARFAGEGGARTLLVDQRPTIGQPVQCGEFLPTARELADLLPARAAIEASYWVPPETILGHVRSMVCVAPSGHRFRFPLEGYSVSRRAFDQRLAERAVAAGAELRHPCGVSAVRGSVVQTARGPVEARVVIGADGPLSTVARGAGFHPEREMFRMVTATVDGAFDDSLALYFGSVAPGGYAWVIPKGPTANVGLGVNRPTPGRGLSRLLGEFLGRESLAAPTEMTRWWVPLGPPPESAVRGTSLLVGDAANLVMATNGGGIPTAILSGYDAGVVAAAHVRDGTPLAEYDARWKAQMDAPLRRAWAIKSYGDRYADRDWALSLGMHYIGPRGLDAMMRLRWPRRLWWRAS